MQHEPLSAVEALSRLGGVATVADVVALSSRRRVRTSLAHGRVVKLDRRRLALPTAALATKAAVELGGVVSHLSAAARRGWELREQPAMPQVTVDRRRDEVEQQAFVQVFRREVAPADRDGWGTAALRTVLDCGRDLPFADGLTVADSALRHAEVTEEELEEALDTYAGEGVGRLRRVLEHADGRAANPFESTLRALCLEAGLPVVPQYEVVAGGTTLHQDLANPVLGVIVEADSYASHGMKAADHRRDCARYNALVVAGWSVLRFTWEHVMHDPTYVNAVLRDWLAGHRAA